MEQLTIDEYEIQHYGFSSTYLILEFKTMLIDTIKSILNEMKKCVVKKLELSEEKQQILHNDIKNLTEIYVKQVEAIMNRNEVAIRNIFAIPENIVLEEDKINEEIEMVEENEICKEIKELEEQYLREKAMLILMDEELKSITKVENLQVTKLLTHLDKHLILNNEKSLNNTEQKFAELTSKIKNSYANLKTKRHNNLIKIVGSSVLFE